MRIVSLLLCLCLCQAGSGLAEGIPEGVQTLSPGSAIAAAPTAAPAQRGIQPGTAVAVASTTPLQGHFGVEMFGENTSDIDVWSLIHGYATVARTQQDGFVFDATALKDVTIEAQADGRRIYTFDVMPGLVYNDGSPLTAADYVFSLLLSSAPEITALGGRNGNWGHIEGFDAYSTGESAVFSGVRLLSQSSFSIAIPAESQPLFYGMAMLRIVPHPASIIAPGCSVKDDGQGAYIEGPFDEALLRNTLLDAQRGYLYHPAVTSGPYTLIAYDAQDGAATFEANARYRGNHEGAVASIERITFSYLPDGELIDALTNGRVDLLNKVTGMDSVSQGQDLASRQQAYREASYLRDGLAYLSFACDAAPTDREAVRRAIAMALDRDAFVSQETGPSAHRVYGYYGLGQWMTAHETTLADGTAITVSDALQLLDIPYSPEDAAALLASDGWTLDASGAAYADGIRYRRAEDGSLVPLVVSWARAESSDIARRLESYLAQGLEAVGIGLEVEVLPFDEVLSHYYGQAPGLYNLYFMGSNFQDVFDPLYDFNTDDALHGNVCGITDADLSDLARKMRATQSGAVDEYVAYWLQYQARFMELVPMIPLYSNVYFDFYRDTLTGYDIANYATWSEAILKASVVAADGA